jgi:putative dehydrogenase
MTTVGIIAMGEMGSGVARRLHERGATVITQLTGRSAASAARAERAGAAAVSTDEEFVRQSDFVLSIVPPGDAVALAERLAPAIKRAGRKTVYVDCNAVSPQTAARIGEVLEGSGCIYVDAGIIGPPPGPNARTIFYASGPGAGEFERLSECGLTVRVMDGPNGAASAMKLGSTRHGTADALLQELSESQPMLLNWMRGFVSRMPPKAYRWVAEMEEIAQFQEDDAAAREMYLGIARFYEQIAAALEAPKPGDAVAQLKDFCAERSDAKRKSA